MKRFFAAAVLTGLVAFNAASVEAATPSQPTDAVTHQIVVVNGSVIPVHVFVEDAEGRRYELGRLERGETRMFEAPADVVQEGDFRVRVHPGYYSQRYQDPAKITTASLNIGDDETVILWLDRELSRSKVEVRHG